MRFAKGFVAGTVATLLLCRWALREPEQKRYSPTHPVLEPFDDLTLKYIAWAFKIPRAEAIRFSDWLESIRPERQARASEMSVRGGHVMSIVEVGE